MLGGGIFTAQNKVLPGAYINFISKATAKTNLGDRGYVAMALELDWGEDNKIITVTSGDFQKNSMKIFGYSYDHDKMKGLRDLFLNAKTLYAYKLTSAGVKASNSYAKAKYCGVRGNDIKIVVQANVDDETKKDVLTYLGTTLVDKQTVTDTSNLVANDYVEFVTSAELSVTAGTPLEGGTNGTVDGNAHQAFLDKIESYPSVNVIATVSTDETIKSLYASFEKRMREETGIKMQAVVYRYAGDHEGVINAKNKVTDEGALESSLVYWTAGLEAATAINASVTNKLYNGEFTVDTDYTQAQLEAAIKAGEFTLHQVGDEVRVLKDINSLVTTSDTKGDIFKDNKTIRIIDQIANDIATVFNTEFLGTVPNDESGRLALWNRIVNHHKQLQDMRAIQNFSDTDVTVSEGDSNEDVVVSDAINIVGTMTKLYMSVVVG